MTRRYKSFKSLVAKRPPSNCTIGRRSGGNHGQNSQNHPLRTIAVQARFPGWFRRCPSRCLRLLRKLSTTRKRFGGFAAALLRACEVRTSMPQVLPPASPELSVAQDLIEGFRAHIGLEDIAEFGSSVRDNALSLTRRARHARSF